MLNYIVRRVLLIFPTLIGVTGMVFLVMALSPGGVAAMLAEKEGGMRPEQRQALRDYLNRRYGLDRPVPLQYLRWLNQVSPMGFETRADGTTGGFKLVKAPDLGHSFTRNRSSASLIVEAVPITLLLNVITIPIIYLTAVFVGVSAAKHRGSWFDVSSGVFFLALWSVPVMWAGVMCIGLLANEQYLRWFPTGDLHDILAGTMPFLPQWTAQGFQRGWLLDTIWHLVLPVLCLTYGGMAFLSKLARGSILDNISQDYVRTAWAKGLDARTILWQHVFRNSLLPLITVAAGILPGLLAGSVVVETIFGIPGMGRLAVEAVKLGDRELVLALTLIAGILGLVSNLLADICYAIADPRVSYE